ncbi:MAG TPA: potassium channel protein [Actinomycetota bacterium]|nr:potassium channel protein [Actinomycetota bacterium]
MNGPFTGLRLAGLFLVGIFAYGVVGYMVFEGWDFLDALYMTVLTLTSVGYREVRPLDTSGKWFTMTLLMAGVSLLLVTISIAAGNVAQRDFGERTRRKRMKKRIDDLDDHFIVCAYGRVGRAAARHFEEAGVSSIVVDKNPDKEQELIEDGVVYLIGDGSSEEVLHEAGIDRARGLVCAVDSDAANVYITLTARAMRPDIYIVARASEPEAPERLQRAGANRVVSPFLNSGRHMAALASRPGLGDYLEISTDRDAGLRVEEVVVEPGSEMVGATLGSVTSENTAIGLRRAAGTFELLPEADSLLGEGDTLILLGNAEQLHVPKTAT